MSTRAESQRRVRGLGSKLRVYAKKMLITHGLINDLEEFRKFPPLISGTGPTEDANSAIRSAIEKGLPLMAARLGRGEVRFLSKIALRQKIGLTERAIHRVLEGTDMIWSGKDTWFRAQLHGSVSLARQFFDIYAHAMQEVDILGSWSLGESLFTDFLRDCFVDNLSALEPYRHSKPWSRAMEGKRVLVIHPFAKSIDSQ